MNLRERTRFIKTKAADLGFTDCGIARAERLDAEAKHLEDWLNQGYQGEMHYLERYFDKRLDPQLLVPGSKSVICFTYNYYSPPKQVDGAPKVSRYAYGRDYHKVIKKKLKRLWQEIQEEIGQVSGRFFVDSGPVMERVWAEKAGLGWRGKNTLLIHPKKGSYFFLAVMITDLELEADTPLRDYCGSCTKCIEACPTDAIKEEGYTLDASKCISYLTIELKDDIPEAFHDSMENWVFGCDICQEVCPWNRFSQVHEEPDFEPREHIVSFDSEDWHSLDELLFEKTMSGTPLMRAGYRGIRKNLRALKQKLD